MPLACSDAMVRPGACGSVADGVQPAAARPGTTSLYAALNVALLNLIPVMALTPATQILDGLAGRRRSATQTGVVRRSLESVVMSGPRRRGAAV